MYYDHSTSLCPWPTPTVLKTTVKQLPLTSVVNHTSAIQSTGRLALWDMLLAVYTRKVPVVFYPTVVQFGNRKQRGAKHVHSTFIRLTLPWNYLGGSLWPALIRCKLPVLMTRHHYSTLFSRFPVLYATKRIDHDALRRMVLQYAIGLLCLTSKHRYFIKAGLVERYKLMSEYWLPLLVGRASYPVLLPCESYPKYCG